MIKAQLDGSVEANAARMPEAKDYQALAAQIQACPAN